MHTIAKLSTSTRLDWPADAIPQSWIESLFEKMLFTYGAKFSDQWKNIDPSGLKRHWAEKLGGLNPDELKTGVAKLDSREWPPTLPEFVKLCRPAMDPMMAYHEGLAGLQARESGEIGTWSHPAIYWATVKVGAFDLRQQTYTSIKGRWERALADEMAKTEWAEIKQPPLQLTHSGPTPVSREFVAAISRQLNAAQPAKKIDHRAWAHRIIEREKRKDKTLTPLQVRMAKEALRVPMEGV